ncbi:MAG TPA: GyrI-like domain-containing protein [Saprospiraceae bacterium]|nr:GyrI-like domain-containing protein [Saprospiraceae bacterium]HRO07759.1 GyrI-like domain-containing protein [Saprospiraceae bacterium]HRP41015.1 GyrI-like domain-containing protein [Saprospiraceae bacterium]
MTRTKKYLIAVSVLIVLVLTASIFKSSTYSSHASIEIEAPVNFVFNAINNLSYQEDWNAKSSLDTSYHVHCGDNTIGKGVHCDYLSQQYGDGIISILTSIPNDSIMITEESSKHNPKQYQYKLISIHDKSTKITLTGSSESGWITNLWNFIHKWKLKKHLKHQLDNLKVFVLERYKLDIYNDFKIETTSLDQKYYLIQKANINISNIEEYYTQNISALYQTALENNLGVTGMPCALFYNWDKSLGKTDMAAALPVLSEMSIAGTQSAKLSPGTALKLEYTGEKRNIRKAHRAIEDYMLDHYLKSSFPVVEEYMTSPVQEPDPTKWVTNIYYYVSEQQH